MRLRKRPSVAIRAPLSLTPTFIAEQGHWLHRPGLATVEVVGLRDDIETVKVGGSAVIVLRGELVLSSS